MSAAALRNAFSADIPAESDVETDMSVRMNPSVSSSLLRLFLYVQNALMNRTKKGEKMSAAATES